MTNKDAEQERALALEYAEWRRLVEEPVLDGRTLLSYVDPRTLPIPASPEPRPSLTQASPSLPELPFRPPVRRAPVRVAALEVDPSHAGASRRPAVLVKRRTGVRRACGLPLRPPTLHPPARCVVAPIRNTAFDPPRAGAAEPALERAGVELGNNVNGVPVPASTTSTGARTSRRRAGQQRRRRASAHLHHLTDAPTSSHAFAGGFTLSYENGEPFEGFDRLPDGSPARPLLAVFGVDGPLGEDAMPVMHADTAVLSETELDVVLALYAKMPVFDYESWVVQDEPWCRGRADAPTSCGDSVYTGTHYGADEFSLPGAVSGGVPFITSNDVHRGVQVALQHAVFTGVALTDCSGWSSGQVSE